MKILILCNQYPSLDCYSKGTFFHVRNKYYLYMGCDLDVISFTSKNNYCLDNIDVYTPAGFNKDINCYDLIVCHAPHYKTQIKFIKKYCHDKKVVFFFHGNEVLNEIKNNPNQFMHYGSLEKIIKIQCYIKNSIKLLIMKYVLLSINGEYVFVSNWMKEKALHYLGIREKSISGRCHVINNSVGEVFEKSKYDLEKQKTYDFVTIRGFLDGAKYGIDLVVKLALCNPNNKFLIIGQGNFFDKNPIPKNVTLIKKSLTHEEIIDFLNDARCSLLLTRWDSQGLMTCETATFGMPTITSDIDVCHEMLDSFDNVAYIDNNGCDDMNLSLILDDLIRRMPYREEKRFYAENTVEKEIELYRNIVEMDKDE